MTTQQVELQEELTSLKGERALVDIWRREIDNAKNYHEKSKEIAKQFQEIYEKQETEVSYNSSAYPIFWSNTQTLKPLLFSKLPKINIAQANYNNEEIARLASELIERLLNYMLKESDAEKRIDAFGKFLELCKDNKVSREELIKFIKQININPAQNLSLATSFYRVVLNILDKKFAINEIKNLKSTFDALGDSGKRSYQSLVESLSIDKYKVNRGDRAMFKGNDPKLPKLDLISGKKCFLYLTIYPFIL
jgi:hypothetical protein